MTKVRDLREGDVVDLQDLPYEIDLDEEPLVEFELAVVSGKPFYEDGIWWIPTRQHGTWHADPDFEIQVQTRILR